VAPSKKSFTIAPQAAHHSFMPSASKDALGPRQLQRSSHSAILPSVREAG
jgi:hypothetical protein